MAGKSGSQVSKSSREKGFTLVEMMIVVGIIAILSALAFPAYQDYVRRGKIVDGTSALSDARVQLEHYYDNGVAHSYVGFACPSSTKNFTITCPTLTDSAYVIQADGISSRGMAGFTYTIDQANTKVTVAVPSGWTKPSSNCWAIRKDGTC